MTDLPEYNDFNIYDHLNRRKAIFLANCVNKIIRLKKTGKPIPKRVAYYEILKFIDTDEPFAVDLAMLTVKVLSFSPQGLTIVNVEEAIAHLPWKLDSIFPYSKSDLYLLKSLSDFEIMKFPSY